ncbi:hypothetical protein [uncultured Ruminococcus sp.]|uniref:hypothetical protein n=1 Tax=uncultured Ruminococcus sp. TaxID=165186 RepID=UPI0025CC87CC|nr:hypothetical protein [uncultured Ruminococcus sp.]
MKKNSRNTTIGKIALGMTVLMMAMSAAGCGNTENADSEKADSAETTTTTTTAAEASEAEEEPEVKEEEKTESEAKPEDSSETPAVTTLPEDFDASLDAMMSSIEAEIPDITAFSGFSDSSKPEIDSQSAGGEATTTTTTSKPDTNAPVTADLKNEQQLVFDGKTYDNTTFVSGGIDVPAGWAIGSSSRQYENSAYPNSYIVAGPSKGASFTIPDAKKKGETSLPSLQLYKGLTWGATADDIKAAYGTPVKESNTESYGTSMTNLWYKSSDGALMVYEVSADWGLIVVDCFGK